MKNKKGDRVKTFVIVMTAILVLMSMLPIKVNAQATGDISNNEIMYDLSTEQGELYNNGTQNSVLATPQPVTNVSANPSVIAVNTGITELRVDAAGIDSPIDVVTVDLSPIGGNASTVMSNIGNYTKDNISWTMYNYTTNASVEGTFNLTVKATDINGNYNDSVSIMLEVKKAVIPFSMIPPGTTYIMNITYDLNPLNVGKNATVDWFNETAEIDNETYFVVNITKPDRGTKMYVGVDRVNDDFIMKRVVRETDFDWSFDPVMFDFPLWVGKNISHCG